MGESRLERGLRVVAWTALLGTLLALIGIGIFLQPPQVDAVNESNERAPTAMTPGTVEEDE